MTAAPGDLPDIFRRYVVATYVSFHQPRTTQDWGRSFVPRRRVAAAAGIGRSTSAAVC